MCQQPIRIAECLDGKALSGAINMGRTRVRASSVIVKTSWTFVPSWRRWQGNGYISRYRRRAAPRHQNVTKIGSFSVSQPPAAAKQQPAVGHLCHIRTSLSSSTIYIWHWIGSTLNWGSAHFTPVADIFTQLPFFALFPKTPGFSRNHHPSTYHHLVYHAWLHLQK